MAPFAVVVWSYGGVVDEGERAVGVAEVRRMVGGRIAPESEAVMERWRWTCDCGASDYAHRADDCAADLLDHLAESHHFLKVDA